ncbi:MAG: hypothetical protein ABUT20_46585, partial [Bacteroidota bacterium]
IFGIYSQRWSNEIYGHYYQALSKWRIDSTMAAGAANTDWYQYIEVAKADTNANKRGLITAYNYFVGFNINILKNKDSALYYAYKMQSIDPGNKDAEYYIKVLTAPAPKSSTPKGGKGSAIPEANLIKKNATKALMKS